MTRARDLANQADLTFDSLALESTDAGNGVGPIITLDRNSASPANWDKTGAIVFSGRNDADESVDYFRLNSVIEDNADGTENGRLQLMAMKNGTLSETIQMNSWGDLTFQGYNPKIGWVDHKGTTNDLYVGVNNLTAGRIINFPDADGTLLTEDSNNKVAIGGITAPIDPLTVATDATFDNGDNFVIASFMPATSGGESSGILFGSYPASGYAKQGIFWERYSGFTGNYGRGKLHFVNRDATDDSIPTTADARMTILEDGKVGIGTDSPDDVLEIKGSTNNTSRQVKIVDSSDATATHIGQLNNISYFTNNTYYTGSAWTRDDAAVGTSFLGLDNGAVILGASTGATPSERMRVSSDGYVTTPNQPSCSVYNMGFGSSATSWSSAGSGSVNGGLVGVIQHNNGNHYNTSTGYFTAPVAGYYLCNLNVYGKKDNNQGDNSGYWWGYFQKNGGYYYGNYIMEGYYNSGDYDQGASISSIIYLAANDTVRPYCGAYAHGVQVYGPNTGFSCQLLG